MLAASPFSRMLVGEKMDSPDLPEADHRRALAGLRRINAVSRTAQSMAAAVISFAKNSNRTHLRVLDVASGGGDVPLKMAAIAKRKGITIDLTLFDRSDGALRIAADAATQRGMRVQTIAGDATRDVPAGGFDVVTNSLFLHHLTASDVVAALVAMGRATKHLLLVSDLRRFRFGIAMAHVACHALSRSPIVHFDGPASVRAAWTPAELADLAQQAQLRGATIEKQFPGRMLLRWEPA